jgi:acetyl-CoA carboxylase biotin carboxyl carrier protein
LREEQAVTEQRTDTKSQPRGKKPEPAGACTDARPLSPETASLLSLVDRLASLLERSDLVELEVESGQTGIVLRKPAGLAGVTVVSGVEAGPDAAAGGAGSAVEPAAPVSTAKAVRAPLTGVFYAAPAPGSPPYVTVGQQVSTGQVIGLIEAMKLFNEIKSDTTGRVVRVVAESGKLVKAKQPLIEVEP